MSIDFRALLFDPVYTALGVAATITPKASGLSYSITVIDKTAGKAVPATQGGLRGSTDIQTIKPAAAARMYELAASGLERSDLYEATLAFNGKSWVVRSHVLVGSPAGDDQGEITLFLEAEE